MISLSFLYPLSAFFSSDASSNRLPNHSSKLSQTHIFSDFIPNRSPERIALVDQDIHPTLGGRVRFQGSYWHAKSDHETLISAGQLVEVMGRDNITLLVKFIPKFNSD